MNTFENDRQKCKKVKIQRNMDDFHWKISIPGWKLSKITKNVNSSPECPIWLIFRYFGPYNQWNKFLAPKPIFSGPTYPKRSQIGQSSDELLRFLWFFTNHDFQPVMLIFQWKSFIIRWIFTFLHFCLLFSKVLIKFVFWSNLYPIWIWTFFGWIRAIFSPKRAIFGSFLHRALYKKSAVFGHTLAH